MSEVDRYFHEVWLGMVQPIDGLVVSIPVLVDAQCMERQPPHVQQKLLSLCDDQPAIVDLPRFLSELLGLTPELFDAGDAIPDEVSLYVPEGKQTIRPTLALKKQGAAGYELLLWDLPPGLDLDKPETTTGTWDYPPSAKLDRLLRHCRVPIGLLTNRHELRLVYAPHGESSGAITFRLDDMVSVGGRPILDAFVMLLSANRFFGVSPERALPALLAESRTRQANVTNELADQVFEALQILLRGFEAASERDGRAVLDDALERGGDHLYKGLLTVLLRLVFLLYAEDRALLPIEQPVYADHLSVLALFEQLQADRGAYPDSMSRRYGAWGRLIALFRAMFLGCAHGALQMPPRRGTLFNPHEYPFLEGWGPGGSAPITLPEARAEVRLPTVDDETIFRVLEKLLVLDGQRLSYRALDVEQIGSVYEALMGYHVQRILADAVCMRPDRLWLTANDVLEVPAARRAKWLKETVGLSAAQAEKLNEELKTGDATTALEALSKFAAGGRKADPSLSKAKAGQLVLQPGAERRRTSSHYTPRSLSAPIVRRTLEPLLAVMGDTPASERILNLKICDPAMGSGAFLVEACRFLADQVLAAWTREGKTEDIAKDHGDPLLHARRLVAQRCLYGVDKNDAAVELAKLSLWLVTLSKTLPFTFLDHCLRHGDSLVGLDFDQIRNFHWKVPEKKPSNQLELFGREIAVALEDAIQLRQKIGDLGDSPGDDREKARLFWDSQDALDRVRLIGDLVIGAFFAHAKDNDREAERARRESLVREWLASGEPPTNELVAMQREIRKKVPVFHWMIEFPDVFYTERPDPLEADQVNRGAMMDAFMGNPPFAGKNRIIDSGGDEYLPWLLTLHAGAHGNSDLSAHFIRRCAILLGLHGTAGFITTGSIAQGDTRATGLAWVVQNGASIYAATTRLPWVGGPNVAISVLHFVKGRLIGFTGPKELDGAIVDGINSQLCAGPERKNAPPLETNADCVFVGSYVLGMGFMLTPAEREILVERNPRNAERIFPYLGGQELNTSPTQSFERYIINFGQKSLEEAEQLPDLLAIVRERVKPERDKNNREVRKKYWWRYGEVAPALYSRIAPLMRCLVNSQVSKHLVFAFQSTDRVFGHTLYVYPIESFGFFSIMQSRVHESWARYLSSTLEDRAATARIRYAPSDCFAPFPFPQGSPLQSIATLERVGCDLYDYRATYMATRNVGLTIAYNRLKDPTWDEPSIRELRTLHEDMDRRVLQVYAEHDPEGRWTEVNVPPFCPMSETDHRKLEKFENEVIERLFVLNAKRAEGEKLKGMASAASKRPKKSGLPAVKKSPKTKKSGLQLPFAEATTETDETEG